MSRDLGQLVGGSGAYNEKAAAAQGLSNRLSMDIPTVKERYQEQLADAQRRVERITEIIALLDKNTDTERLLTLIQQQGGY